MAFTSYDDLIAEITAGKTLSLCWQKGHTTAPVAANWYHLWTVGGFPGAGIYGGTDLNFQRTTDTRAGAIYHGGNKSPDTKHLISAILNASAGAPPPMMMLVDMVGYYPIASLSNVSQNFVNTTGPDRYVAAGEPGLMVAHVNTALGSATATNLTVLTYVNQDGTTGKTIPTNPANAVTVSAAAPTATLGSRVTVTTGAGPFLPLAAGDMGVRSLTNITYSTTVASPTALLLCRPLGVFPMPSANVPGTYDLVMQLTSLARVLDGACLSLLCYFPAATAATIYGNLGVAWG